MFQLPSLAGASSNGARGSTLKRIALGAGVAAGAAVGVLAVRAYRSAPLVLHVIPDGDGGWKLSRGNGNDFDVYARKRDAVSAARELAHHHLPCRLVIHRTDGSVQAQHRYEP